MTEVKPSPSPSASTETPRRSRTHSHSPSSPTNQQQQQQYPIAASFYSSPSPPLSSSFSPPPSPSTLPLTHAHTHTHDPLTTTNDIDIDIDINNNTTTGTHDTHHHRSPQTRQDHHRGRSNNNNHIHTHHHSSHHRHNNITSSSSRRTHHIRRHSASAYYAGPVDHDRVIRTANAHAEAAASGIHTPRIRQSRLLLSPKGPQPQRHLLRQQRQQRQQQQQLLRHQQQRQPQSFLLHIPQHLQQQQQEQEQQHHTSRRGSSYSKPASISPSSSISIFSPPVLLRSSSMPLVHTRPLDMQDQEESVSKTIRQTQLLPQQPLFYRSLQPSRRHRQPIVESVTDQEQDPVKPIDEPPPDPRLIRQKLLQLQEIQQREERQQEQRRMQAFRIKKFSQDSSNIADLDYHPAKTIFKEGFQEHWGDPILEYQSENLDEDLQEDLTLTHNNITQQDDHDVEVARSGDEHDDGDWKERRRRQRQQEQDIMDTDSAMETDKTGDGDGDGDEEMDPHTRLLRARKAKEDAMKDYEEASRILLRAKEREQAILYEYEADLIEVEVGSSVSQQRHRHPGGHGLGHHFQNYSPLIQQQRQQQQELEERGRLSSPITTAAAAAAVAFQNQDENANEGMLNSQIVPQVSDTPSIFSETPLVVMAPSGSVPTRALTPMTTTTTENQDPNQAKSGSQVRDCSQSVTSNNEVQPIASPQLLHHSNSPLIKIKSEEQDVSLLKKNFLGGGSGVTGPDSDSKRRRQPRYEDFDITIEIPSSVGSSDVGVSGQPKSSNAQDRGKQKEKSERQLPDRWRSPTPVPPSMRAKREAAEAVSMSRPQGMSWESTRPLQRFGPGGPRTAKVVPVDLLGGRGESSQQQQQQRPNGSSSRPVLLSSRSFVPRPRPYPQAPMSPVRRDSQAQAPVGGGGLPSNFFTQGMPTRPPPPPSSPLQQQQQQQQEPGQGQGRSSPLVVPTLDPAAAFTAAAAAAFTGPTAAAFTGPTAAPTPRYAPTSNPQAPLRLHNLFVDENGRPYQPVVFYTHIERVENFHHQYFPTSTPSRGVSASPRSAWESPDVFTTRSGGGVGMEDVRGGGYEDADAAMDGEQQRQQSQSRTTSRPSSRQADRDERQEEERRDRKPPPKNETPFL